MLQRILILSVLIPPISVAENRESLVREDSQAEAVCINGVERGCYVLVGNSKIDVTAVESLNLGKLSTRPRNSYSKIINFPTKWLSSSDGEYMVNITTQAWFEGQRYSVTEPVLVKNGVYHQR